MKRPKRQHIRPIEEASILEKRFKKLIPVTKRIPDGVVLPLVVIADLRRGSISSLNRYLAHEQGIPDRGVALELRKLLSGTIQQTGYRLIVMKHPDTPKDKGGRPPQKSRKPKPKELAVARDFEALRTAGEVESAAVATAKTHKIKPSTVYAYSKRVTDYEAALAAKQKKNHLREERRQNLLRRREAALLALARDANGDTK